MRLTPTGPAVIYLLGSACGGAAIALGLVCVFCLPADSPTTAPLSVIALGLGQSAALALVAVSLHAARRSRHR